MNRSRKEPWSMTKTITAPILYDLDTRPQRASVDLHGGPESRVEVSAIANLHGRRGVIYGCGAVARSKYWRFATLGFRHAPLLVIERT